MYVKTYRYRVRPERRDAYLDAQARAAGLYRRHGLKRFMLLADDDDPTMMTELNLATDEAVYTAAMAALDADPQAQAIFREVRDALAPAADEDYESGTYDLLIDDALS